jgi:hypothetical protein
MPRLLLVNPWITDVAAFDLWAWPLGLLYWARRLREWGFETGLIDCLDRAHPALGGRGPRARKFHTGKYYARPFEIQPVPAARAGRLFRRYGLPPEAFENELRAFEERKGEEGTSGERACGKRASEERACEEPKGEEGTSGERACGKRAFEERKGEEPKGEEGTSGERACGKRAFEERGGSPPDAILMTSRMTYWYHGVRDAVARCRAHWPRVPIVLGGIYATLCRRHALAHSGADEVLAGDALEALPRWLARAFPKNAGRIQPPLPDPETWPEPAFDLCHAHGALPVLTSVGCPCRCTYCASRQLAPRYLRRRPGSVLREIARHHERWGTTDFVFYDDALLMDSERFFEPLLDLVIASGIAVRFHTPNGLHYTKITPGLAGKMRRAGFTTLRLSLESVEPPQLAAWNREGEPGRFTRAVRALLDAGYERGDIGVYIMAGMPGQKPEEVERAIEVVHAAGALPKLNEYSPIPGTEEWPRVLAVSGPEIEEEPLWQNNSLYYTRPEAFSAEAFERLKRLAHSRVI